MAGKCKREGGKMLQGKCHCGQVGWQYEGDPGRATVCNCRACLQYGAIWIYGDRGDAITITGETLAYQRADSDGDLAFHRCPNCGAVQSWQPARAEGDRYRMAVNLRLAAPDAVAAVPVRRWDGRDSWSEWPGEGRCVGDYLI